MNGSPTSQSLSDVTAVVSPSADASAILSPVERFACRNQTPTSAQLFRDLPLSGYGWLALFTFCLVAIFVIYIEEVLFLKRNLENKARFVKTAWILSLFPGFAMTSYIAVMVPRSGVLCDLVSNVFFSTCLYQFHGLMEDYLGGKAGMWSVLGDNRQISLSVPPCCCCCGWCLPRPNLNRLTYRRLTFLIRQVAVVRPILQFVAAVLWTDGSFIPGSLLPSNAFIYLVTCNLISTLLSMWGLTILKTTTRPDLEHQFAVNGKFISVQLSMITIALTNIVVGLLVTSQAIECTPLYSSKARGETIAHSVFIVVMLPLALMGRFFYRRRRAHSAGQGVAEDGTMLKSSDSGNGVRREEVDIKQGSQQGIETNDNVEKPDVV